MNEPIINLLNDLVRVNVDRIQLYEKAASSLYNDEVMMKSLFYQIADESQELKERLSDKIISIGGVVTDFKGVVYEEFQKAVISLKNEEGSKAVLSVCLSCESAALAAYKKAVDHSAGFPDEIKHMIRNQQHLIKMSHDLIANQSQYQD